MSLDCGRKLEYQEKTHAALGEHPTPPKLLSDMSFLHMKNAAEDRLRQLK